MDLGAIEQQGLLELQATLAGIDQADAALQVPLLRSAIAMVHQRVALGEDGYYDFLAECALLAAQNMQDMRLHDVERRLARVENPDSPSFADLLIETAVTMAVELSIAYGLPWLAATTAGLVSSRLLARSSRLTEKGAAFLQRTRSKAFYKLEAGERDLARARSWFDDASKRLGAAGPGDGDALQALADEVQQAAVALRTAESADFVAGRELAELDAPSSRADKMVEAYRTALVARSARLKSSAMKSFFEGAVGGELVGRLQGLAGPEALATLESLSEPPAASAGASPDSPFLTSTVLGELLTRIRLARRDAALGHRYTQIVLDGIADEHFATHDVVKDLARGLFVAAVQMDNALATTDATRSVIVRGFEVVLWHQWLTVTGALKVDRAQTFKSAVKLRPGWIHDSYLVDRQVSQDPAIEPGEFRGLVQITAPQLSTYTYEGDYYEGLKQLGEAQAIYLYDTFAAPYFAVAENASLLPFAAAYEPERYAEVLDQSADTVDGGISNFERDHRLDEMRIMVVIFFLNFIPSREGKASLGAITDERVLVHDYLGLFPPPSAAQAAPSGVRPDPKDQADRIAAVLAPLHGYGEYLLAPALSSFESALNSLELALLNYALVYAPLESEAAEAPDHRTASEAEADIKALRTQVGQQYDGLLALLQAQQPDAAEAFRAAYGERTQRLRDTPVAPTRAQGSIFDRH